MQQLRQHRFGLIVLAEAGVRQSQVHFRLRPVGVILYAGFKCRNAAGVIAALEAEIAQPEPGVLKFRIGLHEGRIERFSLFETTLAFDDRG